MWFKKSAFNKELNEEQFEYLQWLYQYVLWRSKAEKAVDAVWERQDA